MVTETIDNAETHEEGKEEEEKVEESE